MGSGSRVYDDFDADEDAEYADISDDADGDGDENVDGEGNDNGNDEGYDDCIKDVDDDKWILFVLNYFFR
jgi:hypothetical protein